MNRRRVVELARIKPGRRCAAAVAAAAAIMIPLAAVADTPSPELAPELEAPSLEAPRFEAPPALDGSEDPVGDRIYLDAAAFRAAFEGKTVHLSSGGVHYGSEYYLPGDRSVWIAANEPCRPGDWYFDRGRFCFQYAAEGPYCWFVFQRGDRFFAESMDGFELQIYAVEERPLTCDPQLFS